MAFAGSGKVVRIYPHPAATELFPVIDAAQALTRLRDGNARYVADQPWAAGESAALRRDRLVAGQAPFAVVLGCSDSRVPVELVFDQQLGDLFVIRVAGNIVDTSQLGSVEFAVQAFGTPLVVVLGHTGCGAVGAALDALDQPNDQLTPSLRAIVDCIQPAIRDLDHDRPDRGREAVRANVRAQMAALAAESPLLAERERQGGLRLVGADYCLTSGQVDFFTVGDV